MKSHWKHVRSYRAPLSIRNGLQSGLILASMLSYGTRKISIVTSITNPHCLWCFPTELLSFTGQEDGHWCFCVFREMFDNILITQLWGALLDKGSQIRINIPYYLVMYIILYYSIQDSRWLNRPHKHVFFVLLKYRGPMKRSVSPSRTFPKSVIALKKINATTKRFRLKINKTNLTDTDKKMWYWQQLMLQQLTPLMMTDWICLCVFLMYNLGTRQELLIILQPCRDHLCFIFFSYLSSSN